VSQVHTLVSLVLRFLSALPHLGQSTAGTTGGVPIRLPAPSSQRIRNTGCYLSLGLSPNGVIPETSFSALRYLDCWI